MKKLSEVINYLMNEDIDTEGNVVSDKRSTPLTQLKDGTKGNALFNFQYTSDFRDKFETYLDNHSDIGSLKERLKLFSNFTLYTNFNNVGNGPSENGLLKLNKNYYEINYNNIKFLKNNKDLNENLIQILKNTTAPNIFAYKVLIYMFMTQTQKINELKSKAYELKTFNFLKDLANGKYEYFKEYSYTSVNSIVEKLFYIENYHSRLISFYLDLINYVFLCFNNYSLYAKSENFIKHIGKPYSSIFVEVSGNLHDNFENIMWKNNNSFLNCIKDDIKNKKDTILLLNFVDVSNLNFENLTYNIIDNLNQNNNIEKTQQNQSTQQSTSNIQDNDKVAVIWYSTDNRYNDNNFDKNHTWKSIQDFYKNSEFYSKYLEMKKEFRNIAGQNMWVISFHRKNNQIPSYKDKPKKESKTTNVQ